MENPTTTPMPQKSLFHRLKAWVWAGIVIVACVFIAVAGTVMTSWLLRIGPVYAESDWPGPLQNATEADPQEWKDQVKVYSLGGYVDSEYFWRMKATPDKVTMLAKEWSLSPVDKERTPQRFWRMPASWWCVKPAKNAAFFASADFPAEERGPDGDHYFTMYDPDEQLLYVWYKMNF